MQVQDIEDILFQAFPREDAETWDHVGLSVGDPSQTVTGVYIALDATADAVEQAYIQGYNVLVTHHPIYLDAPNCFSPEASPVTPAASATLWHAIKRDVAIISMHTNLDRSLAARAELPHLMNLSAYTSLEHPSSPEKTGLGALCTLEKPRSLLELSNSAAKAYNTIPRVWGNPDKQISRVAFLGGSLGHYGDFALQQKADAVICGEAGYHVAQDLALRGLSVILLGHDASEFCFVNVLAQTLIDGGVAAKDICFNFCHRGWWIPQEEERA